MEGLNDFKPQDNDISYLNHLKKLYGNVLSAKGLNLADPFKTHFFHYNKENSISLLDAPLVTKSYIFITRPELNFSFENVHAIPFFTWAANTQMGRMCMAALSDPEFYLNGPGKLNATYDPAALQAILEEFERNVKTYVKPSDELFKEVKVDENGEIDEVAANAELENMDIDSLGDVTPSMLLDTGAMAEIRQNEQNYFTQSDIAFGKIHDMEEKARKSTDYMETFGSALDSMTAGVPLQAKYVLGTEFEYNTPFIPLLQNSCTSLSGAKDFNLETFQYESDYHGSNFIVPRGMDEIWSSGQLTTTFDDVIYGPVSMTFMLWVLYIHYVSRGYIVASRDHILERILDYECSIYHFVIGRDGRTIERWCRYTGCYPKTFPLSQQLEYSSTPDVEMLRKISITWDYNRFEPMDPLLFLDFNHISETEWRVKLKNWDGSYMDRMNLTEIPEFTQADLDAMSVGMYKGDYIRPGKIWEKITDPNKRGISGKMPHTIYDGTNYSSDSSNFNYSNTSNNYYGGYPYIRNMRELVWISPDNKANGETEFKITNEKTE